MKKTLLATGVLTTAALFAANGPALAAAVSPTARTRACVATDNGAANPGPNCPKGNGYHYSGITNSNGFNTFVLNDMWNPPGAGHPQTVFANSPGNWKAVSDQQAGNTAVLSYPDVQQINPPPGSVVGRPVFYGVRYTVWNDSGTVFMLRNGNEKSGRIHILTMLDWLEARHLSPAHSGLNQIDFGWEICSTNSKPWTFTMSAYTLRLGCAKSGSTACWSA